MAIFDNMSSGVIDWYLYKPGGDAEMEKLFTFMMQVDLWYHTSKASHY